MEDILILIRNTFISWLVVFVLNWIVEKIKNYLEKNSLWGAPFRKSGKTIEYIVHC